MRGLLVAELRACIFQGSVVHEYAKSFGFARICAYVLTIMHTACLRLDPQIHGVKEGA